MRKFTLIWLVLLCGGTIVAQPVQATGPDVQTLFEQLKGRNTSAKAADELAKLGKENAGVRKYLSNNLPALLENVSPGPVWLNAVRLAGDLKLEDTVSQLAAFLQQQNTMVGGRGDITFAQVMRLDIDPAGKALVQIGEPSVGPVTKLLENADRNVRWRAALVLLNIGSPTAIQALRSHIPKEKDPGLKQLMASPLRHNSAK